MSTKRREGCERTQADSHFTSVLDVRRARSDERVATTTCKLRISPQFWTSDDHEVTRGLRGDLKNSHFTTVSDVRRARSDERVVSRLDRPNPPCVKKRKKFSRSLDPADFLSISSQQIFSADFLSRSSQQIFSADLLSHSQQIFSADLLSRSSQQIFSADFLSRSSQQIFSLSYHHLFAVVRGWWSAIVLSFLSFAVVKGWWSAIVLSFAVVRGWWSAIVLSCWWSILHEFFRRTLSRSCREKGKLKRNRKVFPEALSIKPSAMEFNVNLRLGYLWVETKVCLPEEKTSVHHLQRMGLPRSGLQPKCPKRKCTPRASLAVALGPDTLSFRATFQCLASDMATSRQQNDDTSASSSTSQSAFGATAWRADSICNINGTSGFCISIFLGGFIFFNDSFPLAVCLIVFLGLADPHSSISISFLSLRLARIDALSADKVTLHLH